MRAVFLIPLPCKAVSAIDFPFQHASSAPMCKVRERSFLSAFYSLRRALDPRTKMSEREVFFCFPFLRIWQMRGC